MPVAYTSRLAYREDFERLGGQRKQVWELVRNWPTPGSLPSIEDIANTSGLRVASVCGRVNELVKDGLIKEEGTKLSPTTNKTVKTYVAFVYREPAKPEKPPQQVSLFDDEPEPRYF